jgi:predicted dienelactone hydrolase
MVGLRKADYRVGDRRAQAYCWYPALPEGGTTRPCNTRAEAEAFAGAFRALGALDHADWSLVDILSNSIEGAPILAGRHPLALFNHGGALNPLTNFTLMELLASHGYVAVSIGHAGESAGLVWEDGSATMIDPAVLQAMQLPAEAQRHFARYLLATDEASRRARLRDFAAVDTGYLASLSRSWSADSMGLVDLLEADRIPALADLAASLDFGAIAYLGMSAGASAAFDCCNHDPRARAGINLDGMNWDLQRIDQDVPVPFLNLQADARGQVDALAAVAELPDSGAPGPSSGIVANALFYEGPGQIGLRDDIVRLEVGGAAHMDFTDRFLTDAIASDRCTDAKDAPILTINMLCLAFLDWSLGRASRAAFEAALANAPRIRRTASWGAAS